MITNVSGGFGYCDECGNPIQVSDSDDVITCRCGKMHYWCGSENCREGESKMGARNIITQLTSQIEKLKKECEERCGKMNCMADDILSLECRNKSLQSSLDQQKEENERSYGYAKRLFEILAPQCKPLDDLGGVLTQIDNWSTQHRWIPVEERLPDTDDDILVLSSDRKGECTTFVGFYELYDRRIPCFSARNEYVEDELCSESLTVTHWKPIILPRKEKENE